MRGQAALALAEMDLRDAPCSYSRERPLDAQRADIAQRGGVTSEALRVDILLSPDQRNVVRVFSSGSFPKARVA